MFHLGVLVSTQLALFLITSPYQACLHLSLAIVHQPLVIVLLFLSALEFRDLSRAKHYLTSTPLLRTQQKVTKTAPYRAILLQIEVQSMQIRNLGYLAAIILLTMKLASSMPALFSHHQV